MLWYCLTNVYLAMFNIHGRRTINGNIKLQSLKGNVNECYSFSLKEHPEFRKAKDIIVVLRAAFNWVMPFSYLSRPPTVAFSYLYIALMRTWSSSSVKIYYHNWLGNRPSTQPLIPFPSGLFWSSLGLLIVPLRIPNIDVIAKDSRNVIMWTLAVVKNCCESGIYFASNLLIRLAIVS